MTALISGTLAAGGAITSSRMENDSSQIEIAYERIGKLESDVSKLSNENSRQKVEIALLTTQLETGDLINPLEVVFALIEDIETPAWCKRWNSSEDGEGNFTMAYINSDYEFAYGVSRSYYIGKTDFKVHPENLAAIYFENDKEVLERKRFIDFKEPIENSRGQREIRRFWKFWHQPHGSDYELVCGWEVP